MVSYLLVCGGAMGNYCRFSMVRNEKTDGPVINYDLVLISVPMLTIGATFGVMFNHLFPPLIITIVLTLVCLRAFYRSFKKTIQQIREDKQKKETDKVNENKKVLLQNNEAEKIQQKENIVDYSKAIGKEIRNLDFKKLIPNNKSRRTYLQELTLYPPIKIAKILMLLVCLLSIEGLQGTKKIPFNLRNPLLWNLLLDYYFFNNNNMFFFSFHFWHANC